MNIKLKKILDENFFDLIDYLNELISTRSTFADAINIYPELSINQFVEKMWEKKAEGFNRFSVDMGHLFETYLPVYLRDEGYDADGRFSTYGDMMFEGEQWEIKTGSGDFVQGATHSPKEDGSMNVVMFLYDLDRDTSVGELAITGNWIKSVVLVVSENLTFHRSGTANGNNSRTSLKFTLDQNDKVIKSMVYGEVKSINPNRKRQKFLQLVKVRVN
jgi:hypothetical protein